ncbi:MAG: hypothetical protein CMP76_15300 [Flavobacterium sp.]|uniref:Preprotein translocase subunit SecB n=2 Tax=Flavobacterium TaxID=237 RepID=A0A1M6C8B2_9FLAO|nr:MULTISPECIES: hypothetical protein [Flavobacterium]AWM14617.1 hypothetical protein DI487_12640 [Flavobacterium sediminis]MBF04647.1 hypothetical protein [Flavobacterium sp.]SHI57252.1 hypothetical protein SAMN05444337_0308 [Flavobacterium haoranii]|tara:strand:+ start:1397 stop:1846 length:450 start_codon:yes stop_codon:yes gene_type:complete
MSANLLQPEKIEIVDFKIIKGQIHSPFDFEEEKVQGHNFNVNFELGFNIPDKLIKADFSVNVETKSEKENEGDEEAIGSFSFVYVYYIDNIEELTKLEEDNTVTISPALGNALAAITYSTSRGILMTRFQGTALSNFILPIINPNKLIE